MFKWRSLVPLKEAQGTCLYPDVSVRIDIFGFPKRGLFWIDEKQVVTVCAGVQNNTEYIAL